MIIYEHKRLRLCHSDFKDTYNYHATIKFFLCFDYDENQFYHYITF